MADIITITQKYSGKYDPMEVRRDSVKYPRICRIHPNIAYQALSDIVMMAAFYHGNKMGPDEAQMIARLLYTELCTNEEGMQWGTQWLALEEIGRIIKKAVLTSEKITTINVSSLFNAVLKWTQTEGTELQQAANRSSFPGPSATKIAEYYAKELLKNNTI